jgi:3-oxosteroid 1-dehydrogenase
VLRGAGVADSAGQARDYLAYVAEGVPAASREALLEHGPAMLDLVLAMTPVRFAWVPGYADYYPEAPGGLAAGRSIEPVPFNGVLLGGELAHLARPYLPSPVAITQAEYRWLTLGRHPRGIRAAARVAARAARARLTGRRTLSLGQALAAGLRAGLLRADVPVWLDTALTRLEVVDGRVAGVRAVRAGEPVLIRARRGVLLATGGFERNEEMRRQYQREPTGTGWTTGAPGNTGDGIQAGMELGADTALMDDAWWGPTIPLPRGPWFALAERNLPGSIIVNGAGQRFMNEALPYVEATHAIYTGEASGVPHVPSWLIADQRYRNRYLFAGLTPRQPFPGRWYKNGTVKKADSLEKLAAEIGVPPEALQQTIDRFNGFARNGVDEDFHRGESGYDKYYSDPTVKPNPSLHVIDQGPFYAVKIVPGDLGTKGGLVTDERARVLRPDGSVIPGLYAAGNVSSAVMGHTYAGPGATIGPALVFGYLAAEDLARGDA